MSFLREHITSCKRYVKKMIKFFFISKRHKISETSAAGGSASVPAVETLPVVEYDSSSSDTFIISEGRSMEQVSPSAVQPESPKIEEAPEQLSRDQSHNDIENTASHEK